DVAEAGGEAGRGPGDRAGAPDRGGGPARRPRGGPGSQPRGRESSQAQEREVMADAQVEIEGKRLKVSNLDKVFYPKTGFTKGQVIDYYTRVSGALLPHLKKRPLTLKRYPNGVEEKYFYEKRCPTHRPEWVAT